MQALPHRSLIYSGKKQPERVTWSDECEAIFQKLKATFTTAPVLKVPEVNKPFIVHSDASNVGVGAVLSQVGEDGKEHPIAYGSRKLKSRGLKNERVPCSSMTLRALPLWTALHIDH
jgi:hypothetical protein